MGIHVVLDCADAEALAGFWSEALGYKRAGAGGQYVLLLDESGGLPAMILQQVEEPKTGKNRMHIDVTAKDIEAEVQRLESLGARKVSASPIEEQGTDWIQMADPEGNEFCVCRDHGY